MARLVTREASEGLQTQCSAETMTIYGVQTVALKFFLKFSAVQWSGVKVKERLSLSPSLSISSSLSHHRDEDVIKIKNIKKVWLVLKD